MSKFLKTLAVISALTVFIAGFTSCKNNDDDDNNNTSTTTNTGFEGTYFNVSAINMLKPIKGENEVPYAICSVEAITFKTDGTGTYKAHGREYLGLSIEEGGGYNDISHNESINYTKSGSTLKFTVDGDEEEFTIGLGDKIYMGEKVYYKDNFEEAYAYVNIGDKDSSTKTITTNAIFLRADGSYYMKKITSEFLSFQRASSVDTEEIAGTYKKSGTTITFTPKNTTTTTTGTLSVSDDRTYLTIGELKYKKL